MKGCLRTVGTIVVFLILFSVVYDIFFGSITEIGQTPVIDNNGFYIYTGKQPPYRGNNVVVLVENPHAHNPTWKELKAFLDADDTDSEIYSLWGVCAEFAEQIHNRAEEKGIKAAWVGIDFVSEPGHALNAFETTDKGLVFIDCTGGFIKLVTATGEGRTYGQARDDDKVAYIQLGKQLGVVSLHVVEGFNYSYYTAWRNRLNTFRAVLELYSAKLTAYNQDAIAYSNYIAGKTFYVGTSEWQKAETWQAKLDRDRLELQTISDKLVNEDDSLGTFFEAMEIVTKVEIYW